MHGRSASVKTAAIRLGMKLEGKHVRANGERLIAAHLRGREPFRSCGKIKGVAMPVLYQFIVGMPLRKIFFQSGRRPGISTARKLNPLCRNVRWAMRARGAF